ncbi:MAG: winged helix-turn-helix domain-containing protein [Alphaproteobacteria bacterium]|nr:winged helix-turn-helix domain-containing protein [Alphaproteobacteria bacterium]
MPEIFILIPNDELREAVIEQIRAAKLAEPGVLASAQAYPHKEGGTPGVVIVDEAETNEKTEATISLLCAGPEKPVVFLLGGRDDTDGVSETFSKPFRLGHLITKLRYYLETTPLLRARAIEFGPYRLDTQNRSILRNKEPSAIRLTEKETALLACLAQSETPLTRQEILATVWGYDDRIDTHTLETHIYQLRRKLDQDGENWILSESGAYRLAERCR